MDRPNAGSLWRATLSRSSSRRFATSSGNGLNSLPVGTSSRDTTLTSSNANGGSSWIPSWPGADRSLARPSQDPGHDRDSFRSKGSSGGTLSACTTNLGSRTATHCTPHSVPQGSPIFLPNPTNRVEGCEVHEGSGGRSDPEWQ